MLLLRTPALTAALSVVPPTARPPHRICRAHARNNALRGPAEHPHCPWPEPTTSLASLGRVDERGQVGEQDACRELMRILCDHGSTSKTRKDRSGG